MVGISSVIAIVIDIVIAIEIWNEYVDGDESEATYLIKRFLMVQRATG